MFPSWRGIGSGENLCKSNTRIPAIQASPGWSAPADGDSKLSYAKSTSIHGA
jgi:hypothetical protein